MIGLIIYIIGFFVSLIALNVAGELGFLYSDIKSVESYVVLSVLWPSLLLFLLVVIPFSLLYFALILLGEYINSIVKKAIKPR